MKDLDPKIKELLDEGTVIPAHPLPEALLLAYIPPNFKYATLKSDCTEQCLNWQLKK